MEIRTVCRKGLHALTDDNIYIKPGGDRYCRACRKAARPPPTGRLDYNFPRIKYCSKGHAVVGDNIMIRRPDAVICRRCSNDTHNRAATSGAISPAMLERITCAIEAGAGFSTLEGRVGGRKVGPRIIRAVRFRNWAERHAKPLLKQAIANGAKRYEAARLRSLVTAPAIVRAADDISRDDLRERIAQTQLKDKIAPRGEGAERLERVGFSTFRPRHRQRFRNLPRGI